MKTGSRLEITCGFFFLSSPALWAARKAIEGGIDEDFEVTMVRAEEVATDSSLVSSNNLQRWALS